MVRVPVIPYERTDDGHLQAKILTRCDRLCARGGAVCVLAVRNMRAYFIVVSAVVCQQIAKVPFPGHHNMVETFASDRSDQPFNMAVLPRRARCDRPIANAPQLAICV